MDRTIPKNLILKIELQKKSPPFAEFQTHFRGVFVFYNNRYISTTGILVEKKP